jgi:NAD(P)-dependent dehydrogenase (short-subunit alcohol dehydrogenase family)
MTEQRGVVLVTGGSRGIGAAVCRLLGRAGRPVAVNYARDVAAAQSVCADIMQSGGRAIAVQGDMADEGDIVRVFGAVDSALGRIDGLVANAGITGALTRVDSVTAETVQRVLAVNVVGPFLCAREAVRRMSTAQGGQGGAIVNISSRAAGLGGAGEWVHYAASKGAIDSFTIGLAKEVAGEGIRVNAVAPGLIDTEIHYGDRLARMAPTVPMARAGSADEVAEAVAWLLSPAASYITGTILHVSGGR